MIGYVQQGEGCQTGSGTACGGSIIRDKKIKVNKKYLLKIRLKRIHTNIEQFT